MNFTHELRRLADQREYGSGREVEARWGELLRVHPEVRRLLTETRDRGQLVPLRMIARVYGGVVTRANPYFVVRELPYEAIPKRFAMTRNDLISFAVVMDGKETLHRIEREFLRPVIKGPEMLLSPGQIQESDLRLFDVRLSKAEMRRRRANGALEYLRRGETEDYKVSEDRLKGGIPAERANIKSRRPRWYSLSVPDRVGANVVVPEHFDNRYPSSILSRDDNRVVLDKLFCVEPGNEQDVDVILAALNSVCTWAQYEARGRTQLGQGVLEVKKADLLGIQVVAPSALTPTKRRELLENFNTLRARQFSDATEDTGTPERAAFELAYLRILGVRSPEDARLLVERAWRVAASERSERAHSLDAARMERGSRRAIDVDVEALAARIAESCGSCPDPLLFVPEGIEGSNTIEIQSASQAGRIRVGETLFTQGRVFAGDALLADTGDRLAAEFVRGVLIARPETRRVLVPARQALAVVVTNWRNSVGDWMERFEAEFERLCAGFTDPRVRAQIRERALQLTRAA